MEFRCNGPTLRQQRQPPLMAFREWVHALFSYTARSVYLLMTVLCQCARNTWHWEVFCDNSRPRSSFYVRVRHSEGSSVLKAVILGQNSSWYCHNQTTDPNPNRIPNGKLSLLEICIGKWQPLEMTGRQPTPRYCRLVITEHSRTHGKWLHGKWIGTLLVVFGVVNLVKCPD